MPLLPGADPLGDNPKAGDNNNRPGAVNLRDRAQLPHADDDNNDASICLKSQAQVPTLLEVARQ